MAKVLKFGKFAPFVIAGIFILLGIYFAFLFISGQGTDPLLFAPPVLLIIICAASIFRIIKTNKTIAHEQDVNEPIGGGVGLKSQLAENNKDLAKWNKTNQMRDRLKAAQVAAVDTNAPNPS